MKVIRIEDYSVTIRIGQSYEKGSEVFRGKPRKIYGYQEIYRTKAGDFKKEAWIEETRTIAEVAGCKQFLESIKEYCSAHCAWLHKKLEVEEHALSCLTSRAYRHWKDFLPKEPPQMMIFIFDK